jgi:acetyl-CoA carboxylase biotin carboxyl carrier protein
MDLDRLKALIALLAESSIAELDLTEDGHRVRLVKGSLRGEGAPITSRREALGSEDPRPTATAAGSTASLIQSPLFGICHLTPSPGAPRFIAVGDQIEAGQQLCTIEAMKVFHSVCAEQAGRVDAILVGAGQEVEMGTPLVRILP